MKKITKITGILVIIIMLLNLIMPIMYATEYITDENEQSSVNEIKNEQEEKKILENKAILEEKNVDKSNSSNAINTNIEADNQEDKNIKTEDESTKKNQEEKSAEKNKDEASTYAGNSIISKQTITDGIYKIKLSIGTNMYLDVKDGSTANGANVQIWNGAFVDRQKFKVTYLNNGYYSIMAMHSNKMLDVAGAGKTNGTNVQQYQKNGLAAQEWIIRDAGNGTYNIVSRCNGLNLDVSGAKTSNGTNVQVYQNNGNAAQRFIFEKQTNQDPIAKRTIADGIYKIKANIGTNMYLDVKDGSTANGANVQIWRGSNVTRQEFKVTYLNNGYYSIMAMHSSKMLDVSGAGQANETNVQQYQTNGLTAQEWIICDVGNGAYNIISRCNGLNLDIAGARTLNGTNVQMFENNGNAAQKFSFEKPVETIPKQTIADGIYKIKASIGTNMYLDIAGSSTANGGNAQIWTKQNKKSQKFKIIYLNNGYYSIMAVHSEKMLDVSGAEQENGTNVWQWENNETIAQQWIIQDAGNGTYNIVSRCNGLNLDIAGARTSNGTNVQMFENNGNAAQKFIFEKQLEIIPKQTIADGIYKIKANIGSDMYLDVSGASTASGANVQIWKDVADAKNQKFKIIYLNNGYYKIMALHSRKMLDVAGAGQENGTNVQQYKDNGFTAQQWIIQDAGNGTYNIISRCNELNLDISGARTTNGTNVQMFENNGNAAQKFTFELCEDEDMFSLDAGTYKISSALSSDKVIDISGGSNANGANAQIWANVPVAQQKFKITYVGKDCYMIEAVHSGKVLEVANHGKTNGTNVWQNTKTGNDEQLWYINETDDGYYNIISKYNGLYLDVYGANTANGTNLWTYAKNGSNAQKFKFNEYTFGVDVSKHNGAIDFESLASTKQIDFIIARAGWYSESRGTFMIDEQFERNYVLAKQKNIPVGAYLYSYATSVPEARTEAYALVNYLRRIGCSFELPVFLDIEDTKYQGGLSKQTKTDMCLAFGQIVQNAGYNAGIYSFKKWLTSEIDVNQLPYNYTIWAASWGGNDGTVPRDAYKYTGRHEIWQYTSAGTVSGISGNVDMNISYKNYSK